MWKNTVLMSGTQIDFMLNIFFRKSAFYEGMWKNTVLMSGTQARIWLMCIAYWIARATNTHSEPVILIAFPLQQWLD